MRTGKHTVIGGAEPSQESHNPPGKKKHRTPYRRVSCCLLPPRFFPPKLFFSGTSSKSSSSSSSSCSSVQRLSREMSTAKVSEALSMVQIIACVVASSFFSPHTDWNTAAPLLTLPGHAGLADPPLLVRTINQNHPTELWNQRPS